MGRQSLGRGLSALIGDEPAEALENRTVELDIDLIDPNPEQPRTLFNETSLDELARSIRSNGVVQPIIVRKVGSRYQIVAGERRWRASQRAELHRIPVVVSEVTDDKLLELALVENIQRQELNPIEEANAYRRLIETLGLTQEKVAEQVGKERSVVATSLRLLRLPAEIQTMIENGLLSAGHGRALLMTDDPRLQKSLARDIVEAGWSVRETEKAVKRQKSRSAVNKDSKRLTVTVDANVKAAETRLMRALNTNVKIRPSGKGPGGSIEIEYYSIDDLDRIYEKIVKKME